MALERLKLEQFRRVERAELELAPGVNLFLGPNAQGKTTVIEGISYLSTGRSFRTTRDREVVSWSAKGHPPYAAAEGEYESHEARHRTRVVLASGQKLVWIDGKSARGLSELWGLLKAVLFVPADLGLVHGAPALRRGLVDTLLCQIEPAMLRALGDARRALQNRNGLLRAGVPLADAQYEAFERALAGASARVGTARARLVERLSPAAAGPMQELTEGAEALQLLYEPGFSHASGIGKADFLERSEEELAGLLADLWARNREADRERGTTRDGIHRDDVRFDLDGRDARAFSSQGQARSCVLAVRLAELELLTEAARQRPLLLLDDIMGELDRGRCTRFLAMVGERRVQTLITATDRALVGEAMAVDRTFTVSDGAIQAL